MAAQRRGSKVRGSSARAKRASAGRTKSKRAQGKKRATKQAPKRASAARSVAKKVPKRATKGPRVRVRKQASKKARTRPAQVKRAKPEFPERFQEKLSFWISEAEFASLMQLYRAIDEGGRFVPARFETVEPSIVERLEDLDRTPGNVDAVLWNRTLSLPLVHRRTSDGCTGLAYNVDGIEMRLHRPLADIVSVDLIAPGLVTSATPGQTYDAPGQHTWRVWATLTNAVKQIAPRVKRSDERVSRAAAETLMSTPVTREDYWGSLRQQLIQQAREDAGGQQLAAEARAASKETSHASESDVDYSGRDLSGYLWERSSLTGVRFAGSKLVGVRFRWCTLEECNFDGADLRQAKLISTEFRQCSFVGATLRGADANDALFEDCKLDGADLTGIKGSPEGL